MNETEWARSHPSNIQHAQKRARPVSRGSIIALLAALVVLLGVIVGGIWWMVVG